MLDIPGAPDCVPDADVGVRDTAVNRPAFPRGAPTLDVWKDGQPQSTKYLVCQRINAEDK